MGVTYNTVWNLSWTTYRQNSFWKNNLYHWWIKCKNVPETDFESCFEFWGEINGLNSKLKHRKAQKSMLTRRFVLYLGDSLIIREICRTCKLQVMHNFGNWKHMMMVQFLFRFLFWSALVHSNMWSSTVWTCNVGISCSFVQCFGWVYGKLNPVRLYLLSYLLQ